LGNSIPQKSTKGLVYKVMIYLLRAK